MKCFLTQHRSFERLAMRLLFAWVVAKHIPTALRFQGFPAPNGLAKLIDLSFLLDPRVLAGCRYALYAALVLYVLRIGWSLALPYLTLVSIAVGSTINSQGAISHHLQIVSLVLLAQTGAHFFGLFRGRKSGAGETAAHREDRVINWSQQAIAATYLVSALTKLIHTKGAWFLQSPMIVVQIVKTTEQEYYNQLDSATLASGLAMAEWMAHHSLLVGIVISSGLILELMAPVLLLGRGYAALYGLALITFHETVGRVMQLHFTYNKYLIWIYLVNVPFWVWVAFQAIRSRVARLRTA